MVVNRLKSIVPQIVSPYKINFVSSESIDENIVVAQEMIHNMNNL